MSWLLRILGLADSVSPFLNPSVLYAIIGAFMVGASIGGYGTYKVMSWREAAAITQAAIKTVQTIEKQDAITTDVEQKAVEHQVEVRTVTETIVKEVPVYVTKKADAKCPVPAGAVQLHDAAAKHLPPVPVPAGRLDGAAAGVNDPSGILLSQILDTVAKNYGRYYEVRGQLMDLQDWVRRQSTLGK